MNFLLAIDVMNRELCEFDETPAASPHKRCGLVPEYPNDILFSRQRFERFVNGVKSRGAAQVFVLPILLST
jgi:hypothetical protein